MIGFALKFESLEDLKRVVEHLQGQIEWAEQEKAEPPYIYLTYADKCSVEDAKEFMEKLKAEK
jgi:hypothetical protein